MFKQRFLVFALLFIFQIQTHSQKSGYKDKFLVEFQTILDSVKVRGAILVYDPQKKTYYSNDFEWTKKQNLPASTFKIPNSIIALETGVVENDSALFEWDGQPRRMKIWEQDMIFREAFHRSCVPCYQEIARKVGAERMNQYLEKLKYGDMKVDPNNIDVFWLEGASGISQYQQIDFLKRFYNGELTIANSTEQMMKRLMVLEETDTYILSAKTGWSLRNGNNNGWFVGFVEADDKVYFFATNIEPTEDFNLDMFGMIRKEITYKALKLLNFVHIE